MRAFRTLLVLMIAVFFAYTGIVGLHHGWNLFPIFFGDIVAMTWSGQFTLDFTCLLMFTGLWLAWRHQFSAGGIALGLLGFVGGTSVLAPYLLLASYRADGDLREVLLGKARVG